MTFNSYIFVLLFFPMVVLGYWSINSFWSHRLAKFFLIAMSMWFYLYAGIGQIMYLTFSIVINYFIYWLLMKTWDEKFRKILLFLGIVWNAGSLFVYKYYVFFPEEWNLFKKIIVPLGISYLVFQQIAFLVDAYRKETVKYGLLDYILFSVYFPKMISGPIILHNEFFSQLNNENSKKISWDNIACGMYIFAIGLGKKVLLADTFGKAVDYAFRSVAELHTLDIIVAILSYTLQLYFDFSGYCDMGIGVSKMLNIELPVNFNSPYKAVGIDDFWKRWHITLTRFLTKYIYIPLGGSRKGNIRTYINIFIIFIISGIWHGVGATFLIWGIMHGAFQVITRIFRTVFKRIPKMFLWIITFIFINITWVFFRADSVDQAETMLRELIQFDFAPLNEGLVECFNLPELLYLSQEVMNVGAIQYCECLFLLCFLIVGLLIVLVFPDTTERIRSFQPTIGKTIFFVVIMCWSVFSFSGVSTFLYWEF